MTLNKIDKIKNKVLYRDEMVFCVPANTIENISNEFNESTISSKIWSLYDNKGKYMLRADVEGALGVYQLVPYITIINTKGEILTQIHKKSGKMSIGFSDHIKPDSCGYNNIISKACFNICVKEFGPFVSTPLMFKGHIKTFTELTKGHLGLWFVSFVDTIEMKDTNNYEYKFMSQQELIDSYGKLEKWSKVTLNYIVESEDANK